MASSNLECANNKYDIATVCISLCTVSSLSIQYKNKQYLEYESGLSVDQGSL